ncbi:hypothetical protein OAC38_00615 [Candidatus Poseidoniaceae archaeon]|nr:hypothetical protein [Candidatus Poseidoniaceae archaeon]
MDVGIIGLGSVGNAVLKGMKAHHTVVGYDIDGRGEWGTILETNIVLVCVPTDLSKNRKNLNMGPVQEVATRLDESSYKGLVIYKSTLNVGTMENLVASYPKLRLVYMPEFLRERDAEAWFANPDRLVVSGYDEDVEEALSLFEWVDSSVPRMPMEHMEAEIGKLAHNAYIATKVTFTCEIERLCLLHDVSPRPVMETVWRDRRVLNSAHLTPGLGGFDGKCIPKDTRALASIDYDESHPGGLLQHVLEIGTKSRVARAHDVAKHVACQQPKGKLSNALDSKGNVIRKTLNFTFFALFISLFFIVLVWGILPQQNDLQQYNSEHYIVDLNDSSFNFNEHDYLTFLSFNSSNRDNETTRYVTCWNNYDSSHSYGGDVYSDKYGYSEEQECESYTNYHPVLVNESGNYSFALGENESFLDDCFQTNCLVVGKIIEVNNKHYWVKVTDYRIIGVE